MDTESMALMSSMVVGGFSLVEVTKFAIAKLAEKKNGNGNGSNGSKPPIPNAECIKVCIETSKALGDTSRAMGDLVQQIKRISEESRTTRRSIEDLVSAQRENNEELRLYLAEERGRRMATGEHRVIGG